ncbi:OLC1v1023516C1 [Oldenlandia corymbosa var. corymbosa]|uniref:OLC1v1023516C1 n=1 Tax=Oldenlandia corymbosa var. corymbosa TaxID=529605 RepID=A0AAV1C0K8_OLDCO|nr:OLC1v1023516C1 [Oldenlandia corymbosa var. corymbosa]
MSNDHQNNPFYHDYMGGGGSSGFTNPMSMYSQSSSSSSYNHFSYMSFTDCLQGSASDYNYLSGAFDNYRNSSPQFAPPTHHHHHVDNSSSENQNMGATTNTTNTSVENPNSSLSCSSNEDGGGGGGGGDGGGEEEESSKSNMEMRTKGSHEDGDDKSKKLNKQKKKGEKKPREPRFAFMTKSEIDHLEDGYRWRKYGQKAVKNSPFPRSYYRCTSQKCSVKKRVERSYQDPSIVITTYEGQHNHHCPATLRGNAAALLSSSFFSSSSNSSSSPPLLFPTSDFLMMNQMLPAPPATSSSATRNDTNIYPYNNPYYPNFMSHQQQQFQLPQDNYNFFPPDQMNSSSLFMPKPEP